MKSGAVRVELRCRAPQGDPLVQVVEADQRLGSSSSRTSSSAPGRDRRPGGPARCGPGRSVQPVHRPDAADREVGAAAEEVGALVTALERRAVEVLHRLVDRQLAVAVLDDHPAVDDVDLADPVQVDAAPVPQLAQHQALVVEALRAQQGDGEHDGVDPVGAGRPPARLHGPDALDLTRRADDAPGGASGRRSVPAQVERGQRHGLVVEAARRPRPARPGSWRRWPRPSTARRGPRSAGNQRPVDLAGRQQRGEQAP